MTQEQRTTGETIYQTCLDLHNAGRLISRQILEKMTGFRMQIIDDHTTRMVEVSGRLRRVSAGILEVVEQYPPNRPISKTILGGGTIKIEVENDLLHLTPSEARTLAGMLLAEATQLAQLRSDREMIDRTARLERQVSELQRRENELIKRVAKLQSQTELAFN